MQIPFTASLAVAISQTVQIYVGGLFPKQMSEQLVLGLLVLMDSSVVIQYWDMI
jgi:hypothetical protein